MGKIAGLEVGLPASIDDVDAAWMTAVLRTSGAIGQSSSVTALSSEPYIAGGLLERVVSFDDRVRRSRRARRP